MKFELPTWEQLPNVDLYMDQVLTYLNDELGQLYFHNEKFVTSSMINNYVKIGIVKRPEKKHYTKEHLAYFIAVTILKKSFSMQEIAEMINIQINMENSSIEKAYDLFIFRFTESLNAIMENKQMPVYKNRNDKQSLFDKVVKTVVYKINVESKLDV